MANVVKDSSKLSISPQVKSILALADKAIADSSSLSDLVGRIVSTGLDKVIKGENK